MVNQKLLYVMTVGQLSKIELGEISGIYFDDPRRTLKNLIWIKNIYDRRKIVNIELNEEISNFKMKVREDRLSKILDKGV